MDNYLRIDESASVKIVAKPEGEQDSFGNESDEPRPTLRIPDRGFGVKATEKDNPDKYIRESVNLWEWSESGSHLVGSRAEGLNTH